MLLDYLSSFYHRSQPLFDVEGLIQEIREEFEKKWESGEIESWSIKSSIQAGIEEAKQKAAAAAEARKKAQIDSINDIDDDDDDANQGEGEEAVPDYSSVESIEKLGLDKLKELLQSIGAKCGGTLHQRAERLFTILNSKSNEVPLDLLKGSKKKRSKAKSGNANANANTENTATSANTNAEKGNPSMEILRPTAEREYVITALSHELRDVLDTTLAFTEKKAIQSYAERVKDGRDMNLAMMEEVSAPARSSKGEGENQEGGEDDDDDDEDEKPIYNPLNLPLGHDGKPIPYWLYKKYGLDEEFKCEICGNYSYWGRRAYDNHFQEWRHHNGMRCLGIPNTKHFHDITKIEDAKSCKIR